MCVIDYISVLCAYGKMHAGFGIEGRRVFDMGRRGMRKGEQRCKLHKMGLLCVCVCVLVCACVQFLCGQ